jgi:hypothetical protein
MITRSGSYTKTFLLFFGQLIVPIELIASSHYAAVPSRGHHRFQNLLNSPLFGFSAPRPDRVGGWNRKAYFLGKWIVTLSPIAPIKLSASKTSHPIIFHFHLLIFCFCVITHYAITAPHSMAKATTNKPLLVNPSAGEDDVRNNSMSESAMKATSSSPIRGVALMADGKIPEMSDFFKKTLVTDTER